MCDYFAAMTDREKTLLHFANNVLEILERDKDWGADTLDDVGMNAIELGLATSDENAEFKIIH